MKAQSSLALLNGLMLIGGIEACSSSPPVLSSEPPFSVSTAARSPSEPGPVGIDDAGPSAPTTIETDAASADAKAEAASTRTDAASEDAGAADARSDASVNRTERLLGSALRGAWLRAATDRTATSKGAPRPFFLSKETPLGPSVFSVYQSYWLSSTAPKFLALGPLDESGIGDIGEMASHASLLLARSDATGDLAGLTDFSGLTSSPRIALACEMFLGQPLPPDSEDDPAWSVVTRMRELCAAKGALLPSDKVATLVTRRVKLLRASECGLPSGRYGAYVSPRAGAPAIELPYVWPDFAGRGAEFAQPCVGAFLHVEAHDRAGRSLGSGWMMARAVADLGRVPFPYQDKDPEHGTLDDFRAAPRGEFVSARAVHRAGAGVYLGKSPLWIVRKTLIGADGYVAPAAFGKVALPACTAREVAGEAGAAAACELAPEAPFVFPLDARGAWTRQALSTLDPRFSPMTTRSDAERKSREDTIVTALTTMKRFFKAAERPSAVTDVGAAAEKLSAMWHSLQTYRAFEGERVHQLQQVPLAGDAVLLVPAQGYLPLGALDDALVERLAGGLDALHQLDGVSSVPFETFDL